MGKKVCKLQVNTFSASLPLFLAKIRASPSETLPPGFHGQDRAGVTPHRSPQSGDHARDAGFALLPFRLRPGSGLGVHPRPSQWEGSWKKMGAGKLGGCLWPPAPPRGDSPGSSSPHPQVWTSQQQSFPKKMLVMATAPAKSGRTCSSAPPEQSGRRRGRSQSRDGGGPWREARPVLCS